MNRGTTTRRDEEILNRKKENYFPFNCILMFFFFHLTEDENVNDLFEENKIQ